MKKQDIVEVIRCINCKHYWKDASTTKDYGWCCSNKRYPGIINFCRVNYVDGNGFCSYGEMK